MQEKDQVLFYKIIILIEVSKIDFLENNHKYGFFLKYNLSISMLIYAYSIAASENISLLILTVKFLTLNLT